MESKGQAGPGQKSTIQTEIPSRLSPQTALGLFPWLHPFVLLGEKWATLTHSRADSEAKTEVCATRLGPLMSEKRQKTT